MKSAIVAEPPLGRQHFFRVVCGCPKGLLDAENFGKLFWVFSDGSCWESNIWEARTQAGWNVAARHRCAPKVTIVLLISVPNMALKLNVAHAVWNSRRSDYSFSRTALNVPASRSVSDEWREIHFAGTKERKGSELTIDTWTRSARRWCQTQTVL